MRADQLRLVIEFDLHEDIVLELGSSLQLLRKERNANIQLLNVPSGAPPNAPRAVVNTENFLLYIGLTRIEVALRIPDHIKNSMESTCDFTRQVVTDLLNFFPHDTLGYKWMGIVTTLEYPTEVPVGRAADAVMPVFDRLINIKRKDTSLSSFQVQFGYQENSTYKTFTVSGYEKVDFPLNPMLVENKTVQLKITPELVSETGISITIDINNKPSETNISAMDDFDDIIIEIVSTFRELPSILNLEGIL